MSCCPLTSSYRQPKYQLSQRVRYQVVANCPSFSNLAARMEVSTSMQPIQACSGGGLPKSIYFIRTLLKLSWHRQIGLEVPRSSPKLRTSSTTLRKLFPMVRTSRFLYGTKRPWHRPPASLLAKPSVHIPRFHFQRALHKRPEDLVRGARSEGFMRSVTNHAFSYPLADSRPYP